MLRTSWNIRCDTPGRSPLGFADHNDASQSQPNHATFKAATRDLLGKSSAVFTARASSPRSSTAHTKPTPLVLDRLEFQRCSSSRTELTWSTWRGRPHRKVLVRESQTHPRRLGPIHVDFYQVNLEEKKSPLRCRSTWWVIGRRQARDADVLQPSTRFGSSAFLPTS